MVVVVSYNDIFYVVLCIASIIAEAAIRHSFMDFSGVIPDPAEDLAH